MAQKQLRAGAAAEAPLPGIEAKIADAEEVEKAARKAWRDAMAVLEALQASEATEKQLAEQRVNVRVAQDNHTAATNR